MSPKKKEQKQEFPQMLMQAVHPSISFSRQTNNFAVQNRLQLPLSFETSQAPWSPQGLLQSQGRQRGTNKVVDLGVGPRPSQKGLHGAAVLNKLLCRNLCWKRKAKTEVNWYLEIARVPLLAAAVSWGGRSGEDGTTLFADDMGIRERRQKALKFVHQGVKESPRSTKKRRS